MSLRRRMALVFLLANALSVGVVLAYASFESRRVRRLLEEDTEIIMERTARLLVRRMRSFEDELRDALVRDDVLSLAIDISELNFWDTDPLAVQYLERAVLLRYSEDQGTMAFPPRPHLRFEDEGPDAFSKLELRELVAGAEEIQVARDDQGRRLVYGALNLDLSKNWGVCFRLRNPEPITFDPAEPIRALAWLLAASTALVLAFLYLVFRASVLEPLRALEQGARRASAGVYDRRVPHGERGDEIGRVAAAMNEMMERLTGYRGHMEGLVDEATERFKRAEGHLVVAQRLAAMGRLAAGVAHEVNNPLAGVLNAVRRLGRIDLPEEKRRRSLEIAEDGLRRIETTVRRLLESTPRRPEVVRLRLLEVVERARDLVQPRLEARAARVEIEVPRSLEMIGDRNELAQVFMNLMLNAVDAIQEGGLVAVSAREDADRVEVEVRDDGCGMSEETASQIFDLFFTTKPGSEGTGLGLAIVHNIVTGHGGTISVDTRLGEGTTFRITFPKAREEKLS